MKIANECVLIQVESSDIVDGKFEIPADVLYIDIGAGAFSGCKNLKTLKLPEKMEYIEDFLFAGCSSLEHIEIPNSVHGSIGMSAFEG